MSREEVYNKIEDYLDEEIVDAITRVEDSLPAPELHRIFPDYDVDWCAEDFTRDIEDKRNAAINAVLDYMMAAYFYYE